MHKNLLSRLFSILLISIILISSLAACKPAEKKITISGAFALYPLVVQWAEEYQKIHPDVRIDITAGGAGKGMSDMLSGAVDIGMISRDIKSEETSQGAFGIAVTKDAVFAVISKQNPYADKIMKQGLTKEALAKVYITAETTTWGQLLNDPSITDEIHAYTRSDSAGAAEMWAKFLGGSVQDDLKGVGVSGDPGLLDAVIKDPLGIGYNNLNYAFDIKTGNPVDGAIVVPIDANNNQTADADEVFLTQKDAVAAVANGKYPSPPARLLYLATKGKPTDAVKDFIQWILNDGQKYVADAGYINLTDAQLATEQDKLK